MGLGGHVALYSSAFCMLVETREHVCLKPCLKSLNSCVNPKNSKLDQIQGIPHQVSLSLRFQNPFSHDNDPIEDRKLTLGDAHVPLNHHWGTVTPPQLSSSANGWISDSRGAWPKSPSHQSESQSKPPNTIGAAQICEFPDSSCTMRIYLHIADL